MDVSEIVSIITSVITACALVASVISVFLTGKQVSATLMQVKKLEEQIQTEKEDIKSKYDLERKKEALKQSEWFAKNVDKIGLVYEVFAREELKEFNKIDLTKKELRFTQDEMKEKINSGDVKEFYSKYIKRVRDPKYIYIGMLRYNIFSADEKKYYLNVFSEDENIKEVIKIEIINKFDNIMSNLLNEMEAFSMAIVSGVADKDLLYPSLHQLFIFFVKSLYFCISCNNIDGVDRYYRYIVCLFNDWNQKTIEMQDKVNEHMRKDGDMMAEKLKIGVN